MKKSRHSHCNLLLLFLLFFVFLNGVDAQQPSDSSSSDNDYPTDGSRVSPSMALIVVVLVLGFFITGCISIYVQQCSDNNTLTGALVAREGNNLVRINQRGLDQSVIDTFPTFLYSDVKELKFGEGTLECAVCLNEFEKDETLRLLPKCDHVFHSECIDAWLSAHTTCPVCRANLIPDPAESLSKDESHTDEGESGPSYEVITVLPVLLPKGRVPRSNSTGHSLVRPSEDRYTLRLPDEVRKQLMMARPKLKRSASLVVLPRVTSSRRGYRSSGGEGSGSSRYSRFLGRSFRWTTRNDRGDRDLDSGSKRFFGAAVTPVEAMTRLPV